MKNWVLFAALAGSVVCATLGSNARALERAGRQERRVAPVAADRLQYAQATPPGQIRKLRAAYLKSLSFSPLFLAQEKGYFREEGLEIDLDVVQSASDVVAFLGTGRFDLAFGNLGIPLFNAAARGVNVKVVAGVSYYPSDAKALSPCPILVVKSLRDSGAIASVADLKGRKIAFNTRGGVIEYLAAGAVSKVGLTISDLDVVTVPFPDMAAAMANGAVAAAAMPEPLATAVREQGIGAVLDPNPVPGALATVLMFGSTLLEGKPDDGRKVMRALRRAAAELSSPERIMSPENVTLWAKSTELPAALVAKTAPYSFDPALGVSVSDLSKQQDYLYSTGQISQRLPLEKIIDGTFAVRIP
ncbi:MAG: ABC transporter substrate-binding protein [Xanthobacteraceae bacterium]